MPIYEYRCEECGRKFEQLRRMSEADKDVICPKCESRKVKRQVSTFAAGGCGTGGRGRFS
jgi:putative FmdB family regulatory protein